MTRPIQPGRFDIDIEALRRLRKRLDIEAGLVAWQRDLLPRVDFIIRALTTKGANMTGDTYGRKESEAGAAGQERENPPPAR